MTIQLFELKFYRPFTTCIGIASIVVALFFSETNAVANASESAGARQHHGQDSAKRRDTSPLPDASEPNLSILPDRVCGLEKAHSYGYREFRCPNDERAFTGSERKVRGAYRGIGPMGPDGHRLEYYRLPCEQAGIVEAFVDASHCDDASELPRASDEHIDRVVHEMNQHMSRGNPAAAMAAARRGVGREGVNHVGFLNMLGAIGLATNQTIDEIAPHLARAILIAPTNQESRRLYAALIARQRVRTGVVDQTMGRTLDRAIRIEEPNMMLEYLRLFGKDDCEPVPESGAEIFRCSGPGEPSKFYFDFRPIFDRSTMGLLLLDVPLPTLAVERR